jgi:hypothetical protein
MKALGATLAGVLLTAACDNVAVWSENQARRDVEAILGAEVRFSRVDLRRSKATEQGSVVCGRANGRRFRWLGEYDDGGEVTFFEPTQATLWRAECDLPRWAG